MTKQDIFDKVGNFTWGFDCRFLIKIEGTADCYIWYDPEYDGDNTIHPYKGNPLNFTSEGFCGRDKGVHIIRNYVGDSTVFVDEPVY